MIAAPSDNPATGQDKPEGEALRAFTSAGATPAPPPPVVEQGVPLNAVISQQIVEQVKRRGVTSRFAEGQAVDARAVAVEPEEIGERGSGLRRCIVSGEILAHEQMIRFVVNPEGVITPDLSEKLPARGYWVRANRADLQNAVVNDAFSRAAGSKVTVPPALIDQVVILARRACLNTLGLARRSWEVDLGRDFARQSLIARRAGVLLIALNAPSNIQHELDGVKGETPIVDLFNTAELSTALGRESLLFATVHKGQWLVRFMVECQRLARLLGKELQS
jgi:uncharacterized protein